MYSVVCVCLKYLQQKERNEENGEDSNIVLGVEGDDHGGDKQDVDTAGHHPPHHAVRLQFPDQCFTVSKIKLILRHIYSLTGCFKVLVGKIRCYHAPSMT